MRAVLSILTAALLTWELYGVQLPRISLFDLDASLPIVTIQHEPVSEQPVKTVITENPAQILTISTPRPYIPGHDTEPGMSDDVPEEPEVTDDRDAPQEVTLRASAGTSFLSSGDVIIHNETNINVKMEKVMARQLTIELEASKPQILIVHTHASEEYWNGGGVADIGERLTELLTAQGFNVIHDKTVYDRPAFNSSYSKALEGISKTLKEHSSIQVVLDIHRDSVQTANGTVKKPVTVIDGEMTSQLMFVVGTSNGGLPHENWPQNLALAVAFQKKLAAEYPDLMRPIDLRKERFNQHTTKGSLILEVGAYGNELEEARRAAELFAEKAAEVFKELLK